MASKLNKNTINFYELQASTDSGDSFLTIMYVVEVTLLASQQQFSSNVVSCFWPDQSGSKWLHGSQVTSRIFRVVDCCRA